ncbi:MAG: sialate O-acetylesterase, partial [Verrucomicrobia bacterium]|nr:sialate O-acetylesterase [Verrucomicrobiota bacterium]
AVLDPLPPYPPELVPLRGSQDPCSLYNAMIHPLVPFALRGAIWYQGESNHGEGKLYTDKTRALVEGWRGVWNQGPLPFYYVQIAPYQYGEEDPYVLPVFWEAQAAALAIPDTGMAVIHDIGNLKDIHPRNKQEAGRRLALLALAKTYGAKDIVFSGPVFKSLAPDGAKLRVTFDHAHGGLVTRDGKAPSHFEIVGEGTDFVPAEAVIDGDSVVLTSPACTNPVAVRFGWHKLAEPNLANGAGLPAAPFRAGDVPVMDWLALKVGESKDYRLVYSLDLAKLGATFAYDEDHTAEIAGTFDRIAYFLELQKPGEAPRYVYTSMDAFTTDLRKTGIPALASGAFFQTPVTNLTVLSNVPGLTNGSAMAGGNLEFWPNNYGAPNSASVPGAAADVFDFGDQPGEPRDGYGSMQVHNGAARQTVFAINNWKAGAGADLGIGNSEGKTRDWTINNNARAYTVKRLRILIRPAP